jgi:hypothetical protein
MKTTMKKKLLLKLNVKRKNKSKDMSNEKNPIEEALKKRDEADFQAFRMLKRLIKYIDYNPGKKKFLEIIKEFNGDENLDEATEVFGDMVRVVENREDANEAFMQAIKDNPIKMTVKIKSNKV